jgi:CheY-like chemotaxis protein
VVLPPGDLSEAEKLTADEPVVREEFDAVVLDENYSVSGGNQVLMIVEDDADLAAYLSSVFSRKYKVHVFDDGDKAAAEVRDLIPDLIICDIMLPGMNGIDFTKLVKINQETSHIPVIMLTARAGDEDKFAGFQVGADAYIVKPFSINVLEAQVASILKSRQAFRTKFSKQLTLEPGQEVITPSDEKFLRRLLEITEKYMSDPSFDVAILVDEMGMSHSKILKKIKALTGLSLVEFIRSMRIKKAVQIFSQDKLSVSEVAFMVGFSDPKYFGKCFAKEIGMKPTDFIKQYHE